MKEETGERPGPEWEAGARSLQQVLNMLPEPTWVDTAPFRVPARVESI